MVQHYRRGGQDAAQLAIRQAEQRRDVVVQGQAQDGAQRHDLDNVFEQLHHRVPGKQLFKFLRRVDVAQLGLDRLEGKERAYLEKIQQQGCQRRRPHNDKTDFQQQRHTDPARGKQHAVQIGLFQLGGQRHEAFQVFQEHPAGAVEAQHHGNKGGEAADLVALGYLPFFA